MKIISRKEALEQNLKYYFTGKPCKNGHIDERQPKTCVCRQCVRDSGKKWYNKNIVNMEWKKDRIIKNVRNRAKRSKIDFDITVEDLIWNEYCPILGIKLDYHPGANRWHQVSLDKTDPKKGYVKGNVVVMSMRANSIKQDSTVDEIEKLLDYLRGL